MIDDAIRWSIGSDWIDAVRVDAGVLVNVILFQFSCAKICIRCESVGSLAIHGVGLHPKSDSMCYLAIEAQAAFRCLAVCVSASHKISVVRFYPK